MAVEDCSLVRESVRVVAIPLTPEVVLCERPRTWPSSLLFRGWFTCRVPPRSACS